MGTQLFHQTASKSALSASDATFAFNMAQVSFDSLYFEKWRKEGSGSFRWPVPAGVTRRRWSGWRRRCGFGGASTRNWSWWLSWRRRRRRFSFIYSIRMLSG